MVLPWPAAQVADWMIPDLCYEEIMGTAHSDLVVFGVGQLGQLLAGGALRVGLKVTPVLRSTPRPLLLHGVPVPCPVLVSVGEEALDAALADLPVERREHAVLLQNELFPRRWQTHGLRQPTVLVPWFNKKKNVPVQVGRPTLLHGPHAPLFADIHAALEIPCVQARHNRELEQELVAKYAFILTINALGLAKGQTVGQWLDQDRVLVMQVVEELRQLGDAQLGYATSPTGVLCTVLNAMETLRHLPAAGRTAAARLARAAQEATRLRISLPTTRSLLPNLP